MTGTAGFANVARFARSLLVSLFALFALCLFAGSEHLDGSAVPLTFRVVSGQAPRSTADSTPDASKTRIARLGELLFRENRFSTTAGDLPASCSNCHLFNQDPQGLRAYADFFNRSWVSSRMQDIRRLHPRNSPTLFDVDELPVLHYDGEFSSLENLVKGTLSGRPMGWLDGERAEAFRQARDLVVKSYRPQFREAFGVDLEVIDETRTIDLIATAIAEFCRTLKTPRNSAYDRFLALNDLGATPSQEIAATLKSREATGKLKLTSDFEAAALEGMRVFFGSEANCVTCHATPRFTDNSFHNKGTSQREYDRFHGDGSFAAIAIPKAGEAKRPLKAFREAPSAYKPGDVDLGYWNFVDLKKSALRRKGETDDQFLDRMVATFKTPTLRNLKYTFPYLHDGSIYSLEEVITEMARLSDLARAGKVRAADDEFQKVRIRVQDIAPLVAFLNSLNDDLSKVAYPARP